MQGRCLERKRVAFFATDFMYIIHSYRHVHTYCTYIPTYLHTYIHIFIYVYVYGYMYMDICIWIYVYVYKMKSSDE